MFNYITKSILLLSIYLLVHDSPCSAVRQSVPWSNDYSDEEEYNAFGNDEFLSNEEISGECLKPKEIKIFKEADDIIHKIPGLKGNDLNLSKRVSSALYTIEDLSLLDTEDRELEAEFLRKHCRQIKRLLTKLIPKIRDYYRSLESTHSYYY